MGKQSKNQNKKIKKGKAIDQCPSTTIREKVAVKPKPGRLADTARRDVKKRAMLGSIGACRVERVVRISSRARTPKDGKENWRAALVRRAWGIV